TKGKSSFIAQLIEALLPSLPDGCKARIVTAEHYNAYNKLIAAGKAEVWKLNTRNYPFSTTDKAVDGFWPTDPTDPTSKFVAPTLETFQKYPIRVFEGTATIANYLAGNTVRGGLADRIARGEYCGPTDSGEAIRLIDGEGEDASAVGSLSRSNVGW